MFTGLVEDVGVVRSISPQGPSARLVIATKLGPLALGESIAVNGACLTVARTEAAGAGFTFDADCSAETLAKTTLGRLADGARVHLERALQLGARLGGHIVAGHVDGVGHVVEAVAVGDARRVTFAMPGELSRFVAEKGSIAIDGVSLTVNVVSGDRFEVMLVPHTLGATHLAALAPGDPVNLEADVLARYVVRALDKNGGDADARLLSALSRNGYL